MPQGRYFLRVVTLLLSVVLSQSALADMRGLPNVTILADSSLTSPMTEIIRIYSRKHNISITASFDPTSEQAFKISEGDLADIFISAHPRWITDLKQKGLLDVFSLINLAQNRLALVSAKDLNFAKRLKNRTLSEQLLFIDKMTLMVISDPNETALGLYSSEAVEHVGQNIQIPLWSRIKPNILRSDDAKDTLYLIAHGSRAGIVYYSDAHNNPEIDILSVFDSKLHSPITYQAAVVAGENMSHARDFLIFLGTPEVAAIFAKYGFLPMPKS